MSDLKERAERVLKAWEDVVHLEGAAHAVEELEAAEKALVPGLDWPQHDVSRRLATEIVEMCEAIATKLREIGISPDVVLPSTLRAYPSFIRASGDVVCCRCNREYRLHPLAPEYLDWDGRPYMHKLCDGEIVKLCATKSKST